MVTDRPLFVVTFSQLPEKYVTLKICNLVKVPSAAEILVGIKSL